MNDTHSVLAAGRVLTDAPGGTWETAHAPWHEMSNELHPCSISGKESEGIRYLDPSPHA